VTDQFRYAALDSKDRTSDLAGFFLSEGPGRPLYGCVADRSFLAGCDVFGPRFCREVWLDLRGGWRALRLSCWRWFAMMRRGSASRLVGFRSVSVVWRAIQVRWGRYGPRLDADGSGYAPGSASPWGIFGEVVRPFGRFERKLVGLKLLGCRSGLIRVSDNRIRARDRCFGG